MDRLLANERTVRRAGVALRCSGETGHSASARRPVIVVDWSELTWDRRFQLLRAAVPVGGRAVSIYEEVQSSIETQQCPCPVSFLAEAESSAR